MLYSLVVPGALDEVTEVRVLDWAGAPGQRFEIGDLVVELETHKAVVEVRAGAGAVLRQILCVPGDWQQVGAPLAILSDSADEPLPESAEGLAQSAVTFEVV